MDTVQITRSSHLSISTKSNSASHLCLSNAYVHLRPWLKANTSLRCINESFPS